MKIPSEIKVYGDTSFRGSCPSETAEQQTFFNQLRKQWPQYAAIALHPKNEGKRKGKDFHQLKIDKSMGLNPGASDIIIPGGPTLVIELKKQNLQSARWQPGQQEYLIAAADAGAFACVAGGWVAAMQAVEDWHNSRPK